MFAHTDLDHISSDGDPVADVVRVQAERAVTADAGDKDNGLRVYSLIYRYDF